MMMSVLHIPEDIELCVWVCVCVCVCLWRDERAPHEAWRTTGGGREERKEGREERMEERRVRTRGWRDRRRE